MRHAPLVALLVFALRSPAPAEEKIACRLTPLHAGVCRIGKDHILGPPHTADERMPFVIYSFLVEGPGGRKALVDLGPKTLAYTNEMFRRHGFFRDLGPERPAAERYPDDIVQPEGNIFRHLERSKLSPAAIGHIVFTHLHADHHGMDDAKDGGAAEELKEAVLHVSARGWKENLANRRDGRWGSYVDFAFSDFLLRREQAGKVRFEDDAEVFPGLRTFYLGGHSACSQAVVVETASGPAIIASDDVYLYELLERDIIPRIRTSTEAYRKALDRVVDLAVERKGVIIPLHDPGIAEAHRKAGEGWLEELRPRSDRAVAAYLAARTRRAVAKRAFKEKRGRARPGCSGHAPRSRA